MIRAAFAISLFLLFAAVPITFAQNLPSDIAEPRPTGNLASRTADASNMVLIPGAKITIGIDPAEIAHYEQLFGISRRELFGESTPKHSVNLSPFFLDRTLVTNSQFFEFTRRFANDEPSDTLARLDQPWTEIDPRSRYGDRKNLAHWAIPQCARFVYASSAATYGDGSGGMDDTSDLSYLRGLRPLNMYGYSKHMFDLYAARNRLLEQCVGIKYFNVFGPNEQHKGEMRSLVSKAYTQVVDTGGIKLFRSYRDDYRHGEQKRDFIYVKDAVAMTLHLAATEHAVGLFNVGAGRAETWLDLANAVFAAMRREPKIEFIEMPEAMRPNYQYFTQANIERLRASGYNAPVTPLASAVHDYVAGYLATDHMAAHSEEPS